MAAATVALVLIGLGSGAMGVLAGINESNMQEIELSSLPDNEQRLLLQCLTIRDLEHISEDELRAEMKKRMGNSPELKRIVGMCTRGTLSLRQELEHAIHDGEDNSGEDNSGEDSEDSKSPSSRPATGALLIENSDTTGATSATGGSSLSPEAALKEKKSTTRQEEYILYNGFDQPLDDDVSNGNSEISWLSDVASDDDDSSTVASGWTVTGS